MRSGFSALLVLVVAVASAGCRSCGKSSAASRPGAKAAGLEQFVAGTGAVRLGMTEEEVERALGGPPEVRKETNRQVEAAWRLGGDVPGSATAQFLGGPLVVITFSVASLEDPPLPRVSKAVAETVAHKLALKAIHHVSQSSNPPLEMADVLAETETPGRRVLVKYFQVFEDGKAKTGTSSTWYWEVEPGGKALIVEDKDGVLGQPIIRNLPGH